MCVTLRPLSIERAFESGSQFLLQHVFLREIETIVDKKNLRRFERGDLTLD